jgi:small subunit ribosomal protein S18
MSPSPAPTIRRRCVFCKEKLVAPSYEDAEHLRRFTSSHAKILPRKKTGVCAKHQRQVSRSIKQARELGYLPYVG